MSESIIFPPWKAGAAKTSSFTGPLRKNTALAHHFKITKHQVIDNVTLLHSDFVSPDYKRDFTTPRIDKTGPACVQSDVFSISGTKADGRVVERLSSVLQNCYGRT